MVPSKIRAIRLSIRNSEAVHGSPRDQYRRGQQVARDHIKEENFGGTVQGAISVAKDLLDLDGMTTIEYDDYWARGYTSILMALAAPNRGLSGRKVQMVGKKAIRALQASNGSQMGVHGSSTGVDRGIGYQGRIKAGPSRPEVPAGRAGNVARKGVDDKEGFY